MGVTQGAGLSLRWFRDQFEQDDRKSYESLTAEAARVPPGAEGLLWAPYLMGERTPHLDPHARAALVGLTASHTRAHIIRALLEGVAFSLRDTFEIFKEMKVPVETIRLGGGGARSALWRQIQADVYEHEVEMVEAEEGAAYGAALLAGVGGGAWSSLEEACDAAVRVTARVKPQETALPIMRRQYAAFRKLYRLIKSVIDTPSGTES
jgi:xylulokinase